MAKSVGGVLVNCEDGTVSRVQLVGNLRALRKTPQRRINVAIAERIFFFFDVTFFVLTIKDFAGILLQFERITRSGV